MPQAELIEIHVDIHEQDSDIAHYISRRDLGAVISGHMVTGDVVLVYKGYTVGIEIKRGADFTNSLKSGRIHDQLARLTENYNFPILIVEAWRPYVGEDTTEADVSEKLRKHKMTIRTLNRRVTTYETSSMEATLDIIEELCRDLKMKKLNVLRRPVTVEEDMTDKMKVICSLPFIKRTIGERILDEYGSPLHAMNLVHEWEKIDGIGKVKLARIRSVLEDE